MQWLSQGNEENPWHIKGETPFEGEGDRAQRKPFSALPPKTSLLIIGGLLIGAWLLSGMYRIEPDEQGVVLRFGQFREITLPGLHYHLPFPFEEVFKPKVTRTNRVTVGFQATDGSTHVRQDVPEESLMLTGDENIVDIDFTVFWRIKEAKDFLFKVRNPQKTVKATAESAMRDIVGQMPIVKSLFEGRKEIEIKVRTLMQSVLDSYESGIEISEVQLQKVDPPAPVIDAFRDVQRARADQERLRNEAELYRNEIVPRARGMSKKVVQDAEAYREQVVSKASGEAQRFTSIYEEYQHAKEITNTRLYFETLEGVLNQAETILIDKEAKALPLLPLNLDKETSNAKQ